VSRGKCGVDLRSRVCSRPRPGPHSHLLKRHAPSPYPTSFLSPSPFPSLPDVPPRRSPASFVRHYRVGHLPVGIHAAPLSFLHHHPCPCRRRAVGLIAYGNDRGHRAPCFLFALLEHRTAVLVRSMGGCYLRDSALAVRLLFFCWAPVCLREPGVRVWQRALRSLSVRFSNMMRPPALDMYLSSSGLVPACPSLPPQCDLSPGGGSERWGDHGRPGSWSGSLPRGLARRQRGEAARTTAGDESRLPDVWTGEFETVSRLNCLRKNGYRCWSRSIAHAQLKDPFGFTCI